MINFLWNFFLFKLTEEWVAIREEIHIYTYYLYSQKI